MYPAQLIIIFPCSCSFCSLSHIHI
uniref:Uncharacterized protein n=1 Tax=Anguilla anguilla TaxID=7936 RepID=A0A0E9Q7P6_ANGAN